MNSRETQNLTLNRYPNNFFGHVKLSFHDYEAREERKRERRNKPLFISTRILRTHFHRYLHERKRREKRSAGTPYLRIIMIKYFFSHKYTSGTRDPCRAQATRRTLQRDKRIALAHVFVHASADLIYA